MIERVLVVIVVVEVEEVVVEVEVEVDEVDEVVEVVEVVEEVVEETGPGFRLVNPNHARVSFSCSGTVWPTPCARIPWILGP